MQTREITGDSYIESEESERLWIENSSVSVSQAERGDIVRGQLQKWWHKRPHLQQTRVHTAASQTRTMVKVSRPKIGPCLLLRRAVSQILLLNYIYEPIVHTQQAVRNRITNFHNR